MSCGVGHRGGSDPALLWLWCRLSAVALILIQPLAWEPPYTVGAALKKIRKGKKKKKKKEKRKKIDTGQIRKCFPIYTGNKVAGTRLESILASSDLQT